MNRQETKQFRRVMLPHIQAMTKSIGKTVEHWGSYDYEELRRLCGPLYSGVPLDDVRREASNERKSGRVGRVNGHGPSKSTKPSAEMLAYYETQHWKTLRERIREFWGHRCSLCNADNAKDVHHRTYERLHKELLTDVILLCRKCHKVADSRRKWQSGRDTSTPLFR